MLEDEILLHQTAPNEVFLNDPLQHRRIAVMVPRAFGVHDGDRPTLANAKAIRLRPIDAPVLGETELFEATLQVIPRFQGARLVTTLGFCLVTTEEDVPANGRDTQIFGSSPQRFDRSEVLVLAHR
jgi:hypothetical protein